MAADMITILGAAEAIDRFDTVPESWKAELMLDRNTGEMWTDWFADDNEYVNYHDDATMYLSRYMLDTEDYVTRQEPVESARANDPGIEIPDDMDDDGYRAIINADRAAQVARELCQEWYDSDDDRHVQYASI